MNTFSVEELDVIEKLSRLDLSNKDQLNLTGETGIGEQNAGQDAEIGILVKAWVSLKKEMYLALCTDDPKYAELRNAAEEINSPTSTLLVTFISTTIGGIPMAILTPVAKVFVVAIGKIGINVFCKVNQADKVIGRLTQREQDVLKNLYAEAEGAQP